MSAFKWLSCGLVVIASSIPVPAFAQTGADKAAAEVVFDEARRLMGEGKYGEACPKFAESQRLDPGVGVLLYLGDCYEKNGQTASAWAAFREAIPAAKAAAQADREKTARERAAALEPRLLRITVVVGAGAEVAGLEVRRDGVLVGEALWGSRVPVDPGPHVIEATAPGKAPWSQKLDLQEGAPEATVNVPVLEAATAAGPGPVAPAVEAPRPPVTPPREDAPTPSSWSGQKTGAVVAAAVGVAGVAVGAVFGLQTFSAWSDAQDHCRAGTPLQCDREGVDRTSDARTAGTISTIGFGVGIAGLVGATVLWVTAPANASSGTGSRAPSVGLGAGRVVVGGTF